MKKKRLSKILTSLARFKRRQIGIALLHGNSTIVRSLRRARVFADIIVYGSGVPGFPRVPANAASAGVKMINDLKAGKIGQLIRGQIDDFSMIEKAKELYGIPRSEKRLEIAILQSNDGWEMVMPGASNTDFQTLRQKIDAGKDVGVFFQRLFSFKPSFAVMATCRPGSYGKDPVMTETYDEAESVVAYLRKIGYIARNVHIEIETAKKFATVLMPARGIIGNQIFRAFTYLGAGRSLGTPTYFPGRLIYEDNSRNEVDWYNHVIFACALANKIII